MTRHATDRAGALAVRTRGAIIHWSHLSLTSFASALVAVQLLSLVGCSFDPAKRLASAIQRDRLDSIHAILRERPTLANRANREGMLPLSWATSPSAVGILIRYGADPTGRDGARNTALHYAALHGRVAVGRALIRHGAEPNAANVIGFTPLHQAALSKQAGFCAFLMHHGADPEARSRDGQTALHLSLAVGSARTAQSLLESGANANAPDRDGKRPLAYVGSGSSQLARLLRKFGGHL